MLLAGIGTLPETVADRSIRLELERKPRTRKVKPLRVGDGNELRDLGRKAARWAADNLDALRDARPGSPPQLNDRAADAWSPLFAIADLAGGAWPERTRAAAIELAADGDDALSNGVLLLTDLRDLFAKQPSGMLFTREILRALNADETRPWPEYRRGKPLSDRQLAALLKPYKVKPRTVRRGTETEKGYKLEWFSSPFAAYCPDNPSQRHNPQKSAIFAISEPSQVQAGVTDHGAPKPAELLACDGVTVPQPPPPQEREWRGEI
jgi:hypothetical protein